MVSMNKEVLAWLLEPDTENPGVRYFVLRDLLGMPDDAPEVRAARAALMTMGPVPTILHAQDQGGYWALPGNGYAPKYTGTVWQIIFLAELGADPADQRVQRGCEYLLTNSLAANGAFSLARPPTLSGVIPCENGNLLWALLQLGLQEDERIQRALHWQAQAVTGEDVSYLKSGTSGPCFACSANKRQPCGWGAAKVMRALLAVPEDQRTDLMERAIGTGAEFLLSRDPVQADYPFTERVSSSWFRFGFPLSYQSDVLQVTGILVSLGYGRDERLSNAIKMILSKQDGRGRWLMENSLNGKMWMDIEEKKKPSKWVTLRSLRALRPILREEA
jgi:hypothetical protein